MIRAAWSRLRENELASPFCGWTDDGRDECRLFLRVSFTVGVACDCGMAAPCARLLGWLLRVVRCVRCVTPVCGI